MRHLRSLALLPLLFVMACSAQGTPWSPTPITIDDPFAGVPFIFSETFDGTLTPLGDASYAFASPIGSLVEIKLGSVTDPATGVPLSPVLTLGLGVPQGMGCAVITSVAVPAGLINHLTFGVVPGTYCVNVNDPGNLTGSVNFSVLINQNAVAPTSADRGPTSFFSGLTPGGTASRTFAVAVAGTVNVTLQSLQPAVAGPVQLGVGIVGSDGRCRPTLLTTAVPGGTPHISVPVDPGSYCVNISDTGSLTQQVLFTIQIDRP